MCVLFPFLLVPVYSHRLKRQLRNLDRVEVMGKFNGATGNYNAHIIAYPDVDWLEISKTLVGWWGAKACCGR